MKSIAIFNNKGGVGKTTLLCNLASYFSKKKGKRVLVIDADPQSNASMYMLGDQNLFNIFESKDSTIHFVFDYYRKKGVFLEQNLPIIKSEKFGIDVLVGNPDLSLLEDFLSKDWFEAVNGEPRGLRTTLLLKNLLYQVKDKYDLVFFDLGPSLGAINRSVLVACDYMLLPMSSDIFSLKAIENIKKGVDQWKKELNKGLDIYQENNEDYFEIHGNKIETFDLSFIGYVTQQYKAKTVKGIRVPVNAFEKIVQKVEPHILKYLAPYNVNASNINFKLGEIPNLHSMVPLSQNANKPIFELISADGVVGAHFQKVTEFDKVMNEICDKLVINLSNDL